MANKIIKVKGLFGIEHEIMISDLHDGGKESMTVIDELHEVKKPFQDSYDYLKDRYNIKHSYSTFEKNNLKKGFYNDEDDFDLIVMSTLVRMGLFTEAFEEANQNSNEVIEDLYSQIDVLVDELGEHVTKFVKLTLFEKVQFVLQALKEAWHKIRK